ncbi:MAG: signal recognition particle-docking protein FtsY [Nitrosomonas sp.]|nr:MAG: signal recognition particle-docking protein FtsY [Nitrosomonas sp.]
MVLHFLKSGYSKVRSALNRTRQALSGKLRTLFNGKIDEETLDRLEQLLYEADLGVETAGELTSKIQEIHQNNPSMTSEELIKALKAEILAVLGQNEITLTSGSEDEPTVILVVGVNGNGKTTSVAKLAKRLCVEGKKVLLGAGDTFRAAAIDQLDTWALVVGVDIVKGQPGSDPAAVAFDAVSAAKARQCDAVILDTAGRLHTKVPLMQELEKIRRSCGKVVPGSPHEILLALDATTGQNAVDQARVFNQFTPITGIILTKLDGTAKGGIVVSIQKKLGIPVKFIGVGEGAEDLIPFNAEAYVDALFD